MFFSILHLSPLTSFRQWRRFSIRLGLTKGVPAHWILQQSLQLSQDETGSASQILTFWGFKRGEAAETQVDSKEQVSWLSQVNLHRDVGGWVLLCVWEEENTPGPSPTSTTCNFAHTLTAQQGRSFASIPDSYLPMVPKEAWFTPKLCIKFNKRKPNISIAKGFLSWNH